MSVRALAMANFLNTAATEIFIIIIVSSSSSSV
jgi:hypothetical protein